MILSSEAVCFILVGGEGSLSVFAFVSSLGSFSFSDLVDFRERGRFVAEAKF